MADGEVDGRKVARLMERISEYAASETGRPIDELGTGPIVVATFAVLADRIARILLDFGRKAA